MQATTIVRAALAALLLAGPAQAGATWQPTIDFPDDPLVHPEPAPQPGWVKFLILTSDPSTVLFQDSNAYPFHYDFAVAEVPAFAGMSPAEFDAATLHAAGQVAHLGAVFVPPPAAGIPVIDEYGIQLVRRDPYPPAEAIALLQTVAANVVAGPQVRPFYMPSLEQSSAAAAAAEQFSSAGFPLSTTARWADGNACYAHGWAFGELVQIDHEDIELAFLAGVLTPDDVLLTDGIPAEIPQLAGVISLAPATPSSHVAILAQTFDIPFVHLALAEDAAAAQALVGKRVALRARDVGDRCEVRLADAEAIDPDDAAALLDLKTPPPLAIDAIEPYGAISAPTDPLLPSAIRYFGGKAANTGVLRQSIPANTRVSVAFSFDLWEAFLDQTLPGGDTLRQRIATTLAPHSWPPQVALLDAALDDLRETIEDDTVFAPALESAVLATLQDVQYGFVPTEKLRFRSSTNVEDSERFTGAGLYDSNSGCLADDLDADVFGPSLCDASDPSEDGVFDAIRKVFASFFNLNATIERLRYGVPGDDVGMALLVHRSFPDAEELANGVATLEVGPGTQRRGAVVAQPGASSVTNPEPGWIPEEVDLFYSGSGGTTIYPTLLQPSNLVLLGETVLDMPGEYQELGALMRAAADRYAAVTGLSGFVVEFEFKKTAPGGDLVITQIRRIPQSSDEPTLTPFLIDVPTELCALQGEFSGSAFAIHRTKTRGTLRTVDDWLDAARLEGGFWGDGSMEFVDGCLRWSQTGPLDAWPDHAHAWNPATGIATEQWTFDDLQHARAFTLEAQNVPALVAPREGPFVFLSDLGHAADYSDHGCLSLTVDYDATLPDVDWQGPTTTMSDFALLCRCPEPRPTDLPRVRDESDGGIRIVTEYRWPKPAEVAAGYTAPLVRFERTTIHGLTAEPLVLTDPFAQTYKPGHHNFTEEFVFEPALDPNVPQAQLDALAAAGVRVLHAYDETGGGFAIDVYDDAAWGFHCLGCRGPDDDGDGFCLYDDTFDCDDAEPAAWAAPGEATALVFDGAASLSWTAPAAPGGTGPTYDLLRAGAAGAFAAPACVASGGTGTSASDAALPASGAAFFYLVRAVNACPGGTGPVGVDGNGAAREAGDCP